MSEIPLLTEGTLLLVRLDEDPTVHGQVWEVMSEGKAVVVDENYPYGETEDIENFIPADIYIVGAKAPF